MTDPKHHTAEHILHGIVQNDYQGKLIGLNFKGKKTRCDFQVELKDINIEEFREDLQKKANEIVVQNLVVTFEEVSKEEAEKRCKTTHRLPENTEKVRLSKIGELIITPCVGEHVSRTAEIGQIVIRTVHQLEKDVIRLTFVLQ